VLSQYWKEENRSRFDGIIRFVGGAALKALVMLAVTLLIVYLLVG
jgi:hypothetical protein